MNNQDEKGIMLFFFLLLFGLMLYILVNSYDDVGTVSSPYHTFIPWASVAKRLTSILCKYFCL